MWFNSWFRGLTFKSKVQRAGSNRRAVVRKARAAGFRPRLEVLEDRTVPAMFNVTTTLDGVAGSLRQAIIAANVDPGADTIVLPAGTYQLTLVGAGEDLAATGDLDIRDDLAIIGAGAPATIIDGVSMDRIFHVFGVNLTISGLTIQRGRAAGDTSNPDGLGGGVLNNGGRVTIVQCSFLQNSASGANGASGLAGGHGGNGGNGGAGRGDIACPRKRRTVAES